MAIAGECKFEDDGEDWKEGYDNWKKSKK